MNPEITSNPSKNRILLPFPINIIKAPIKKEILYPIISLVVILYFSLLYTEFINKDK